ncbi:MAG: DUF3035 domain-containing protein [Kordiimonadaceae bacterium]|nr:DUF3035 domain-containing protein [Kordiimonadaceae bacterium]MBT6037224.1 DUF3035 domain-containing protein [Kordiimonadaceae bacterium]MBT6329691.1 DUF3035 domain-containing protein [Kordiimonadaceae bacterium]
MKNKFVVLAVTFGVLSALTGCGGKSAPDEYMVLKNAPLSMPPEFHLTPDGPTQDLEDVIDPKEIARRALFGEN